MSYALYLVGYVVLIIGLCLGANLLGVSNEWIVVGAICMAGIGILHGVSVTRQKDPPTS
jgi:hypothetical protein